MTAMTTKTRRYVLYTLRQRVIDCNRKMKKATEARDDVAAAHWREEIEEAQAAINELEAM